MIQFYQSPAQFTNAKRLGVTPHRVINDLIALAPDFAKRFPKDGDVVTWRGVEIATIGEGPMIKRMLEGRGVESAPIDQTGVTLATWLTVKLGDRVLYDGPADGWKPLQGRVQETPPAFAGAKKPNKRKPGRGKSRAGVSGRLKKAPSDSRKGRTTKRLLSGIRVTDL